MSRFLVVFVLNSETAQLRFGLYELFRGCFVCKWWFNLMSRVFDGLIALPCRHRCVNIIIHGRRRERFGSLLISAGKSVKKGAIASSVFVTGLSKARFSCSRVLSCERNNLHALQLRCTPLRESFECCCEVDLFCVVMCVIQINFRNGPFVCIAPFAVQIFHCFAPNACGRGVASGVVHTAVETATSKQTNGR